MVNGSAPTGESARPAPPAPARLYRGPERRTSSAMLWRWMSATLDEIDYGMLLLCDETQVVHANHAARAELRDADHPLQCQDGVLHARRPQDAPALAAALNSAAHRGLRRLLTLGADEERMSISVVPLSALDGDRSGATLVILGKRAVCETLSVEGFARSHGLTPAETRVLVALCKGAQPSETAVQLGVRVSTVRSQIGSIRLKTGAPSIRALVRQVAVLPPLMGVLRAEIESLV